LIFFQLNSQQNNTVTMSDINLNEPGSTQNQKGIKIALIVSVILNIILLFFVLNQRQKIEVSSQLNTELTNETVDLKGQLRGMLAQYDSLSLTNDSMSAEILQKRDEIEALLAQVEKAKNDKYLIAKYKKEAATLRNIMQGYVRTIDSLNTLNVNLTQENEQIKTELTQVSSRKAELEKKTEQMQEVIATGKVLQASEVYAEAIKIRNNGSHTSVNRANRADGIKTCLVLGENRIAEKGSKTIYLRIISPDGKVLAKDESQIFNFNKVSGLYTEKRIIEYTGKPIDTCIFFENNDDFLPGQYIVEVYESETQIARVTTDLR
jgi:regulator of replication initiation timing